MSTMRQRSPTNAPYEEDMAWHTVRAPNVDGSSTVYRVHESVMQGGAPSPCYGGGAFGGGSGVMYGAPAPSSMQGMGAQTYTMDRPTSNVIFVRGNEEEEYEEPESDEEAPALPMIEDEKPQKPPRCSRTTPCCIGTGIFLALSFIVGYVFLIEAVVNSRTPPNRRHHTTTVASAGDMSTLRSGGAASVPEPVQPEYNQPSGVLAPQYYVMMPVAMAPQQVVAAPETKEGAAHVSMGQQPRSIEQSDVGLSNKSRDLPRENLV